MNGQVAVEPVTVGTAVAYTQYNSFNSSYVVLKPVTVASKMSVAKFGVIVSDPLTQVHMALYNQATKELVASTEVFAMQNGLNEFALTSSVTIEPGAYFIAIQGNGIMKISHSNTGVTNYGFTSVFPSLPQQLSSLGSIFNYDLSIYIAGDKY